MTTTALEDRVSINSHFDPSSVRSRSTAEVEAFHLTMPGFASSPLIPLPSLAQQLGAKAVFVKYEAARLGLPSFKIVGASWAVNCAIAERLGSSVPADFAGLLELASHLPSGTTLTTATDGNHGRAVAHVARLAGLPSRIFVPADMATPRRVDIAGEGAEIVVVDGSYDDAVRQSAASARDRPHELLVSDTSWPGYERIPAQVVAGYATIHREALAQVRAHGHTGFDIAFVPAGVGSFASSAVQALAPVRSEVVTVEPQDTDCIRRSLVVGAPTVVPGPHRSIMAGLNCGEVSAIAWPQLRCGVRAAAAVTDDETRAAIRILARLGIPSGESGAAALAGATLVAAATPGLVQDRVVLLYDSEGVTDPDAYAALIGPS